MNIKVTSLDHLKKIFEGKPLDEPLEFRLALTGCFSAKTIYYPVTDDKQWEVHHSIDESHGVLTDDELEKSNIGKGIRNGNFYYMEGL